MPKRRRLSRSGEFDRVYRDGSSQATRYLVLYSFPRKEEDDREVRLGVSVNRKVGGAVDRNRVKRALREAFWALADRLPPGHDFVVVARTDIFGRLACLEGRDDGHFIKLSPELEAAMVAELEKAAAHA